MNKQIESPTLRAYLGSVRSHLPLRQASDILLELESSLLDRIEDRALSGDREPDEALVREVVEAMGEPETVAASYSGARYLISPEQFRPFVRYTALAFCLHMVLAGIATAMDRPIHLGLVAVSPLGGSGFLSMGAAAAHALLLDTGLMVFAFAGFRSVRARYPARAQSLAMDTSWRQALTRAALAALVAVVLNVFRDDVFVIVSGKVGHPLFTEAFSAYLPLVTVVLGIAGINAILYAAAGERRLTLAADALHGVIALAVMFVLLGAGPLMAVPPIEMFQAFFEPANAFLLQLGHLVVAAVALVMAAKIVRRLTRIAQI